jgi:CubicO group peptidase (beta-lactamase class C family)
MRIPFPSLTPITVVAAIISFGLIACDQTKQPDPGKAAKSANLEEKGQSAAIEVDDPRFAPIEVAVQEEIEAGHIPGAVVLVGHQGRVIYRQAFGQRSLEPERQPMTLETIFDLASLTKVVATTTAVMQLWDRRLLNISDPVSKYWPEFGQNGKNSISLWQLLTHTSGLRDQINPQVKWFDYPGALKAIAGDGTIPWKTRYKYGDVDFIVLGEIVQRLSKQPLDSYCTEKIFQPLKMARTTFNPPETWLAGIAPGNKVNGDWLWGKVQDPAARKFGGVAGHAGLFSHADDLSVFAQMLLNDGENQGRRILTAEAVAAMTRPRIIYDNSCTINHGFGWDMLSPLSKEFNASFPAGSFGHTGFTGTSIWIEPHSKTYLIILTNRLHPNGKGQVKQLRAKIAAAVAAAVPMKPPEGALE